MLGKGDVTDFLVEKKGNGANLFTKNTSVRVSDWVTVQQVRAMCFFREQPHARGCVACAVEFGKTPYHVKNTYSCMQSASLRKIDTFPCSQQHLSRLLYASVMAA
jgi:hypothetical protein